MKFFYFFWDQEGCKGAEVKLMHAMHFVAYTFVDIFEVRILFYFGINNIVAIAKILNLLFLFYFGIVRYEVMDVVTFPNFYLEDFLFTISGYDMAPTHDLTQKITLCQRLQCQN